MPLLGIAGQLTETCREIQVEWKIADFFSLPRDRNYYDSPDFSFENVSWHLKIFAGGDKEDSEGFLSLYLHGEATSVRESRRTFKSMNSNFAEAPEMTVNFGLGIKNADGIVEKCTTSFTFETDGCACVFPKFFGRSELLRRKSELLPSDVLTITCCLGKGTLHDTEEMGDPFQLIELEKLSEDFEDLLSDKKNCDTTLKVKEKEFQAHRSVLIARSTVFAAMFDHDTSEKATGVISVPDCDPDSFGDFLYYLYTGKADDISSRKALDLYRTTDKYDVQELKSFCVENMTHNLTVENVCDVVTLADQYEETELLSAVQIFFNDNMNGIFPTAQWMTLLKENCRLANKLLTEMAVKAKIKY